jgi:hypothetical protein
MPSPLRGPAGNIEFLAWWRLESEAMDEESAVVACLAEVE